ncbi:unnamed protein product [Nippostrongylus brasiliensis]|uniref:Uncharacterized protein n=1 Tax=Nippostrongylus brasiliensis TaxID=27835 RepID=A0A0N4XCB2_NIPBR|nr:hypothetical protein Q1695_015652 [Nippostrongylus brasiliensis]VDL62053.1 unnamed protein product [Nippostrongylus brasiliensis]
MKILALLLLVFVAFEVDCGIPGGANFYRYGGAGGQWGPYHIRKKYISSFGFARKHGVDRQALTVNRFLDSLF